MDILAKYKFADWLYNRFVEHYRKSEIAEAFMYLDVLTQYKNFTLEIRKLSDQRRHIKELHSKITKALKAGTAQKLLLAGDEGIAEFNREMKEFEDHLRKIGLSEEYITERVIDKKMNYGTN
ncbi:hypothetical protein DRF65_11185 [Chryseobacterium pennae]|uniref:Uncharacterized protein n=1 Tax=Chryseobacterium pennae TaxID=2258962 RepID=A0A3D9C936_9FLAO|nr:hypothetical protein [Chryseobacterium pennae]REC62269.1 hypothetical protein DRF65_11185 [Chryseobacterium pennae]